RDADEFGQQLLPLTHVRPDRLATTPVPGVRGELSALLGTLDQLLDLVKPLVVVHEATALGLAHARIGTDRRCEPGRSGDRVFLQFDVRARAVERLSTRGAMAMSKLGTHRCCISRSDTGLSR